MDKFVRWWFFKFRSPLQHTSPVILQHFRGTFSVWGLMFKCHCYSKGGDGGSGGCSVKITARTCGAMYKPFRTFLSQGHCWVWPCPRCKNDNCKSWWVWFLPSSPYVGLATLCFEPRNSSFWNRTFGCFFCNMGETSYHVWFWPHFGCYVHRRAILLILCFYGKLFEIKHPRQEPLSFSL